LRNQSNWVSWRDLQERSSQVHKIDTVKQLGDISTKGLTHVVFKYLWKKLMGW
jgi:hypothetical protein